VVENLIVFALSFIALSFLVCQDQGRRTLRLVVRQTIRRMQDRRDQN
jgi:hypothetical protein